MIQNIVKGRGFRGALAYVLGKDGAERLTGTVDGETPRELAAEFRAVRQLRPDVERAVFHASLSAPIGERLSDEQWVAVSEQYLARMGFQDSPYVVVRHQDQAHEHVHVIASRIDVHGRVVSDAHDHYRGQQVLRELERAHGLTRVAASWERSERGPEAGKQLSVPEVQQRRADLAQYERTGERPFGDLVREHAPAAFRDARNWDELTENLRAVGLELVPKRGGLAVEDPTTGETVKASAVGRECARSKLEQRFGVTYDEWQQARERERQQGRAPERQHDREQGRERPTGRSLSTESSDRALDRANLRTDRGHITDNGRPAERTGNGAPAARGAGERDAAAPELPGFSGARDPERGDGGREWGGERGGRGGGGRDRAADRPGAGGPGGSAPAARERAGDLGPAPHPGAGDAERGDGRGAGHGRGAGEDDERAPAALGRDDRGAAPPAPGVRRGGRPADADELGVERDGGRVGVPGRAAGDRVPARDRASGDLVVGPRGSAGARGASSPAGSDRGLDPAGLDRVGGPSRRGEGLEEVAARLGRELDAVAALQAEHRRLAEAQDAARNQAWQAEHAHTALRAEHGRAVASAEQGYRAQLQAVYRDPQAAHRALEARAQAAGWDVAVAELRAAPERFGALHGRGAGEGVAGRVLGERLVGEDAARWQARGAVPVLAGWAAERHAAHAAQRQAVPALAALERTRAEGRETASALGLARAKLPDEYDRLREIGQQVRGLARQLAPAELRQLEQLLTAPHRALLGRARALVRDAVLERERGGMER